MTPPTVDPDRINRLLDWVESTAKDTQGFVLEQAPLVAREIVAWNFWYFTMWTAVGLAYLVVGILSARSLVKTCRGWTEKDTEDFCDGPTAKAASIVVAGIAALVFLICGAITTTSSAGPAIKATVAPRLVILDYIRGASK